MLIIARDMIQKRFFYGMLKRGCALVYTDGHYPQKDPIILYLGWIMVNILVYVCWLFHVVLYSWAVREEAELAGQKPPADEETPMTRNEFTMLITVVLMPAVFILLQFHTDYNIEESLVPLTQYVYDSFSEGDQQV